MGKGGIEKKSGFYTWFCKVWSYITMNWKYIVTLKDLQGNFTISAGDQFTKREFAEIKDLFNLFDIDGNGSITPERFSTV